MRARPRDASPSRDRPPQHAEPNGLHLRPRHLRAAADPASVTRFDEHDVVLPLVVLTELEAKRHHPELGWAARQALRMLEELRTGTARSPSRMPVNDEGGTLRVELNHQDSPALPAAAQRRTPTTTASSPSPRTSAARAATSSSSPRTCRCGSRRASSASRPTSTATSSPPTPAGPASSSSTSSSAVIDELFDERVVDLDEARDLPCNTGVALHARIAVGARPRARRQAGAPRARRPGAVRPARPLRRAAHRDRPARRPRGRHRQPRRQRRHRQERARARGRARGRARAADAQAGGRVPPALRGRRPGPRLPARAPRPRRWRRGRAAVTDALESIVGPRGDRRGASTAACSRCCRSPTSGAGASPTASS